VVSPTTNPPVRTPLQVAVVGTDTGVGKTRVVDVLVTGLRRLGRQVWVHKPIACGGWDGASAEDARALEPLRGPGQSAQDLCPLQFPEPASPHLAARAAGVEVAWSTLLANLNRCRPTPTDAHDLVVEGVGGLLVPLTAERQTIADLVAAARLPVVIVTRPHLGTLNHTALTVEAAIRRGIRVLGLVLNHHTAVDESLAVRSAAAELVAMTGVPLLATLPFAPHTRDPQAAVDLAAAVLGRSVLPV
jgi:dethiobiotin synthetase